MKTMKNRKLHGSVLLTVVAVMSLLIIFLFGTLALATANNNRAHVNYSSAQTSITSRTIVESTLKAMAADDSFGSVVNALDDSSAPLKVPVNIDVNASNAGALGHPEDVVIEYVGKKKFYFTEDNKWDDRDMLKITAKVRLAGVDSTTSAYIVKNPPNEDTTVSGGAGFITTGGASFTTGSALFGGSYINMPPTSLVDTFDYKYSATNPGTEAYLYSGTDSPFRITDEKFVVEADLVVWGKMEPDKMNYIVIPGAGKGVTIWGNMEFETSQSGTKLSLINNTPNGEYDFKDIPYIYIDQKLCAGDAGKQGKVRLGTAKDHTKSDAPLNIFARQIDLPSSTNVYLGGDVYMMDANMKNTITPSGNDGVLYNWSSSVINKYDSDVGVSHTGGSLYSKGDLTVGHMDIQGGIYCEGDLTIRPGTKIHGDVVCGKKLTVTGSDGEPVEIVGDYDFYCNGTYTLTGKVKVNGADFEPGEPSLKSGYSRVENRVFESIDTSAYTIVDNEEHDYGYVDEEGGYYTDVNFELWHDELGKHRGDYEGEKYYVVLDTDGDPVMMTHPWHGGDNEMYVVTDEAQSYYNSEGERVDYEDAVTRYYVLVNADGNTVDEHEFETEDPDVWATTSEKYSYFDSADSRVSESEAYEAGAINPYSGYIYPPYAERDVLLGLGELTNAAGTKISKDQTQVIKRLDQLYQTMNPYSSTVLPTEARGILEKMSLGENDPETSAPFPTFDTVDSIYASCHTVATALNSDGTVDYETKDYAEGHSLGLPVITKSCTITGSSMHAAEKYTEVNGMRGIVFKPTGNMVVVLKDFELESNYYFLVDDTAGGSVYFYVPGDDDIAGSKEDVTNGVTANNAAHNAVKDFGVSTVTVQEGIRTTSYNILIKSDKDFQLTTSQSYECSDDLTKVYEESKRDPMIHYNAAGQIDPPLIEQMHKVLGLANKLSKPKAYLYGGTNSSIHMQNAKIQSVNIISSELKVHINCENADFWNNHKVYYNGALLNDAANPLKQGNPPGVLGCFNANLGGSDQTITSLYVQGGSGSGGDDIDTESGIRYRILYYDEY